jgi:hypothetical protein
MALAQISCDRILSARFLPSHSSKSKAELGLFDDGFPLRPCVSWLWRSVFGRHEIPIELLYVRPANLACG